MDKEYILLSEIEKNENITQRELSKKAELSLGSVNILINKMVHEGLIKIKQIPMNRVAYMLTPAGIAEKVRKTGTYIKIHYNYINETVKKIKNVLAKLVNEDSKLIIVIAQDEISELVKLAVSELHDRQHIQIIEDFQSAQQLEEKNILVIAVNPESYNELVNKKMKVVNLLELIS